MVEAWLMKSVRIVLAAVLGGVVVFIWGFLVHGVILKHMAMDTIPQESSVVEKLSVHMGDTPGFYPFPMPVEGATEQMQKEWEDKLRAGPRGVIIYQPEGLQSMGSVLLPEFASNVAGALIVALILSLISAPHARRALLGGLMGVFAWLSVEVSNWIWHSFPLLFITKSLFEQFVGWALAGAVISLVLGLARHADATAAPASHAAGA